MTIENQSFILPKPRTSQFNLSHNNKFTCDMGEIIPFLCTQVVPGDTMTGNAQFKIDFEPQIKPVMHNVDVYTYFFYVPNRILMDDWKKFIIGEDDTIVPPYINFTNVSVGSLADYIGVPTGVANPLKISALPFRAYAEIFNHYFRDDHHQQDLVVSHASGQDTTTSTVLQNVCWEKDYFTSCTTEQQYGDSVSFKLTGNAPVYPNDSLGLVKWNGSLRVRKEDGGQISTNNTALGAYVGTGGESVSNHSGVGAFESISGYSTPIAPANLYANMDGVDPFSISLFRQAMVLQSYYEKLNISGNRYNEYMKTFYGQTIPDATLSKPEYLGGGRTPVVFSPVLQTSQSTETSPQGNQSGYATSLHVSHNFSRHFNEHGFLIGLCVLKPQSGYFQGVKKELTYESRLDYFCPDFIGLSEQPVRNIEIYAQGTDDDGLVFGYNPRYSELKTIPSSVHGHFRTDEDMYHMDRKFTSLPVLGSDFVICNPTTRIFAVESGVDHLRIVCGISLHATRQVPKFSLPSGLSNKSIF